MKDRKIGRERKTERDKYTYEVIEKHREREKEREIGREVGRERDRQREKEREREREGEVCKKKNMREEERGN